MALKRELEREVQSRDRGQAITIAGTGRRFGNHDRGHRQPDQTRLELSSRDGTRSQPFGPSRNLDMEKDDPDPKALLYRGFITKERVGSDWPTDPINPLKLEVTSQMHSMQKFSAVETYRQNVAVEEAEEPQQGPLSDEEFQEESPRDESLQPVDRGHLPGAQSKGIAEERCSCNHLTR